MAIDFRKAICKASSNLRFLYNLFGCSKYYRYVEVCDETGRLPQNCPRVVNRRFFKDDVPTSRCLLHPFPPPPPLPKFKLCAETKNLASQWCSSVIEVDSVSDLALVCRRHRAPRPDGVPLMILFVADFSTISSNFSDSELGTFAKRLGRAGCGYIRTFSVWDWKDAIGRVYIHPYKRKNGLADWDDPEKEYDRQLARVQRILGANGIGIQMSLFSQQADRFPWSPFNHNTDGLEGYRDISEKAMRRWRQLIDRINGSMGIEGNIIDFGNELVAFNQWTPEVDRFARSWILPLGNHLRAKKVPPPNSFSAGGDRDRPEGAEGFGTGGAFLTRLWKEANWEKNDCFWVHHGTALPEHIDRFIGLDFAGFHHGFSDDGIGLGGNVIPKEKQGTTESEDGRRSSHWTWRVKMVAYAKAKIGARLRAIEVIPMTLKRSIWHPDYLDQEEEVDVFTRIAEDVYGADIRRKID